MKSHKAAWEKYLEDGEKISLFNSIDDIEQFLLESFEYPYLHRICDIEFEGKFYRVNRIIDEEETILITLTNTPSIEIPGVPYWLKGEKLRYWARLETEQELNQDYEPEAITNWEVFR